MSYTSSTHDDAHLTLHKGDEAHHVGSGATTAGDHHDRTAAPAVGRQTMPMLFALDQLKQAGVPLKAQINPYLQMDPSIFREKQPQIIMPEGYESGRGKFEFALGYIGCAVLGGWGLGTLRGGSGELMNNWHSRLGWYPLITRMTNGATKTGSGYAQVAGTAMFVYSATELALKTLWRPDDVLNSFIAGPIAGALYGGLGEAGGSKAGLMRAGSAGARTVWGAAGGLGLVMLWNLCDPESRAKTREMIRSWF